MRKLISILAFIALISTQLNAQKAKESPEQRAAKQTEWMKQELNLTNEQLPKVAAINLKFVNIGKEIRNSNLDEAQTKAKLKEVNRQRLQELKQVLTPEQWDKFRALLKEKKQNKNKTKTRNKTNN